MRKLAVLFALLVMGTGCADKGTETEDPTHGEEFPACADVWQEGKQLPADYEGCANGDTIEVPVLGGDGRVAYDDRLAAKPGETIGKL